MVKVVPAMLAKTRVDSRLVSGEINGLEVPVHAVPGRMVIHHRAFD
jgi:hypothetical protein